MQRATPYNDYAQIFEDQIVIRDNTSASATGGALIVGGGLSTKDTYITGHAAVNNVKITPNLNDIIFEQQAVLRNNQTEPVDVDNFFFDNSVTSSFKAFLNVNVSAAQSKYALWEINGIYRPDGWVITSSFSGDITGVNFTIRNVPVYGLGNIQYTNSNVSGTTTIRFRATTTAPPGTSPFMNTYLVNNTNGNYIADRFVYANSPNTLATTDIIYKSNLLTIGGNSRILAQNATLFTNFSNGGAFTSMGDGSFANNLYVGNRLGVANTSPQYTLDIGGNINFSGNIYKNGNMYAGSSQWSSYGQSIYYTDGNVGIGTTSPNSALSVLGDTFISGNLSTGNFSCNNATFANVFVNNMSTNISTSFSGLFSASNNVTSASIITGLSFDTNQIRSFTSQVSVSITRSTGGNLYETISIDGQQTDAGWTLYTSSIGDVSGITLSINTSGQLQYTSTDVSNWISTVIKYSANTIII